MIHFKFFRGDVNEEEVISQNEWNRRRDALAERIRLEQIRQESNRDLELMIDNLLKELERPELSIKQRLLLKIKSNTFTIVRILLTILFIMVT
jgi:hypothetical protein